MMLDEAATSSPAYIDILPPELIGRIFIWANADESSNGPFDPPASKHISHVCRRWRDIALSCQDLWAKWPRYGRSENWTEICHHHHSHARSLQAPLDLCIFIDDVRMHTAASTGRTLALSQISRARSLSVETSNYYDEAVVDDACADALELMSRSDAPWLESLSLRSHSWIQIPVALFQGKAPPRLHTAIIHEFEFRVSDKIWPESLRVLYLQQACAWRNVDEMVDFFKAIPNLEVLSYHYNEFRGATMMALRNYSPSEKYPIRSAPLPHLKRFYLFDDSTIYHRGGFVPAISMFSYLALPPSVILDIRSEMLNVTQWTRQWDEAADAGTLTGPVAENFVLGAKALRAHLDNAAMKGQSYDAVTVRDRTIQPDLTRQVTDSSALPSALTFVLPHADVRRRRGRVSKIACAMYLSIPVFLGATELDVTRTRKRPILHRFPTLPAVRFLTLSHKAVKDFVRPLRFSKYAEIFPTLETIRFKEFNCDDHIEPVLPRGLHPSAYRRLKFDVALLDALAKWDTNGLCESWRRIEFEGCSNVEIVAERIREDVRLRRFNERVVIVCNDGKDYKTHDSSNGSHSTRSVHSDEGE